MDFLIITHSTLAPNDKKFWKENVNSKLTLACECQKKNDKMRLWLAQNDYSINVSIIVQMNDENVWKIK